MIQHIVKSFFSPKRPLAIFWTLFILFYAVTLILITIPLYAAGTDLRGAFALGLIPIAAAASLSLRLLQD